MASLRAEVVLLRAREGEFLQDLVDFWVALSAVLNIHASHPSLLHSVLPSSLPEVGEGPIVNTTPVSGTFIPCDAPTISASKQSDGSANLALTLAPPHTGRNLVRGCSSCGCSFPREGFSSHNWSRVKVSAKLCVQCAPSNG